VVEANERYWRKVPSIKRIIFKGVPERSTRLAMLKTGEADLVTFMIGDEGAAVKGDPQLRLGVISAAVTWWLEFPEQWDPTSPWYDRRVRLAANLALDKQAINEVERLGFSRLTGSIIPRMFEFALPLEPFPYNSAQAKRLLAEAGHPNGFDAGDLHPFPPFFTMGEAVGNYLAAVGIRTKMRTMERAEHGAAIFAKAEWTNPGGSIKDRPVLRMILEAVLSRELTPDRTILDSSSGNAGIAYAMIGSTMGYQVEVVVPGNASQERKKRIRAHGATLIESEPLQGYDAALREAHRRAEAHRDRYYMPDQYANDDNWRAHSETTAAEILQQTGGRITHFVAGIGTGGTITGVGRRLKEHDAKIQVVCVMPEAFSGIEGLKPLEQPGDIVPKILDPTVIDRRIKVTSEEAYTLCQSLARRGLFVGLSSGAYLKGCLQVARESDAARMVTVFSDLGERDFSTRLWDL